MTAIFEDIQWSDDQRLSANYTIGDTAGTVWFEIDRAVPMSHTQIAAALVGLVGAGQDRVILSGLRVPREAVDLLELVTKCPLEVPVGPDTLTADRSRFVLSFSGGFDSLATKYAMPPDTQLVSLDFGGRFASERTAFSSYDSIVVRSNLVDERLNLNTWAFMCSGLILVSAKTNARYCAMGSIFEGGPHNLRPNPPNASSPTFPLLAATKYEQKHYAAGLTEVATAMILHHYAPDEIEASLNSVALPGSEKIYRKWTLARLTAERFGWRFTLPEPQHPTYRPTWGKSFTVDFLALYIGKFAGSDVRDLMIADCPPEVDELSRRLKLDLYERFNPTFAPQLGPALYGSFAMRIAGAGIIPFTENDFLELQTLREFFSQWHPVK